MRVDTTRICPICGRAPRNQLRDTAALFVGRIGIGLFWFVVFALLAVTP